MKNFLLASAAVLAVGFVGTASAQESRSDRDARVGMGIAGAVLGTGGYNNGYRRGYGYDRGDRYERRRYERHRHRYDD